MAEEKPDYKEIYKKYHSSKEAKMRRAQRNNVRRKAIREGRAHKGDGTEVDHTGPPNRKGPLDNSKTRVVSRAVNRAKKRPKRDGTED